jgi:hypothetical protein
MEGYVEQNPFDMHKTNRRDLYALRSTRCLSPSYYLSVHSWSKIDILLEQFLDVSVGDANL